MNREIAELWIKDLRTNPPQARDVLFDGQGHCCLGRLCELFPGIVKTEQENEKETFFLFDGEKFLLPQTVRQWAGMRSTDGSYNSTNLSNDNDSNGKSFAEIADIIEAHVDEL